MGMAMKGAGNDNVSRKKFAEFLGASHNDVKFEANNEVSHYIDPSILQQTTPIALEYLS